MKNKMTRLLPSLLIIISLYCTAFVIRETNQAKLEVSAKQFEAPPQYKSEKLPLFERLLVQRWTKKLKYATDTLADPEIMAKQAKKTGEFALRFAFLATLIVFIAPYAGFILLSIVVVTGV